MKQILDVVGRGITCQAWAPPQPASELQSFIPILTQLAWVHDEYIAQELYQAPNGETSFGDCTLWYSERPQVGLFAAAVWKCGGIALEEYGTFKTASGIEKRGRGDLFFKLHGQGYLCEAKHSWILLTSKNPDLALFHDHARAAHDDALMANDSWGWPKMALTFSAISVPLAEKDPRARLNAVASTLQQGGDQKLLFVLRLDGRPIPGRDNSTLGHYGMLLQIQLAKRGSKPPQ